MPVASENTGDSAPGAQAVGFDAVLRAEMRVILGVDLPDSTTAVDDTGVDVSALCLSGGGIRSATFALGVMQGLARFGLLRHFHYLSSVSGGGFNNALGRLRTLELVQGRGELRASSNLFNSAGLQR